MPRHKQVTTCRNTGGPLSKHCPCEHCNLAVCFVCGACKGSLTTDCPGKKVDFDRQKEVYETRLDYTDDRGWHQGEPDTRRAPHFESTELPPVPPRVDPRTLIAPTIDWSTVDRNADLQKELGRKAIAWVLADRICEAHSAALARIEDEVDAVNLGNKKPDDVTKALLTQHERTKIDFHLADQHVQKCEEEFKQAARMLVDGLEAGALTLVTDKP